MFSKALFKQSCKANGTMWCVITLAVCFMLACVMMISGNGGIGEVRNSIQNTIIQKEIDSQMEKRAICYYIDAEDGLAEFDSVFSELLVKQFTASGTSSAQQEAMVHAYSAAVEQLQTELIENARKNGYEEDSAETQEMLAGVMYSLNPNGIANDFYLANGEAVPADYDVTSLIAHIKSGDLEQYLGSEERKTYRRERAKEGTAIFLSGSMTEEENVEKLMESLADYGVTKETYDSFGYTYDTFKKMSKTAVVTYQGRLSDEMKSLNEEYENGQWENENDYLEAVASKKQELIEDISCSFLSTLPAEVSEALDEIGQTDLYTLIV